MFENTIVRTYDNCRIELKVSNYGATIEFALNEGFITRKINMYDTDLPHLLKALQFMYHNEDEYPSIVHFWKRWFNIYQQYLLFTLELISP